MIHASAIAESIVAPTLFRPEFLHSLDPIQTSRPAKLAAAVGRRCCGIGLIMRGYVDRLPGGNIMHRVVPPRILSKIETAHRAWRRILRCFAPEAPADGWENRIDRNRFREEVWTRAKLGSGCEHI